MDGKRAPSEEPRGGGLDEGADVAGSAPTEAPGGGQRYGPLTIVRMHKDDGRALLSFARARDPEA
jgi:hypothetical protein